MSVCLPLLLPPTSNAVDFYRRREGAVAISCCWWYCSNMTLASLWDLCLGGAIHSGEQNVSFLHFKLSPEPKMCFSADFWDFDLIFLDQITDFCPLSMPFTPLWKASLFMTVKLFTLQSEPVASAAAAQDRPITRSLPFCGLIPFDFMTYSWKNVFLSLGHSHKKW